MQDHFKYAKYSSKTYGSYSQASTTTAPTTTTRASPHTSDKSSSKQATTSSSRPLSRTYKPRASSSTTPTDATAKASSIQCFTCKGHGHKIFECPTRCTMIANDDGTYDSMSEEEMEALEHEAMHHRMNENEDAQVFCDNDSSPALVVSKVLTLQHQQD